MKMRDKIILKKGTPGLEALFAIAGLSNMMYGEK
jgi:hypothetical protein